MRNTSLGGFRSFLRMLRRSREAILGFAIVLAYLLVGLLVELADLLHFHLLPYSVTQSSGAPLSPPSLAHLLGTDNLGRDLFSRMLSATPYDVAIGYVVVGFALVVGLLLGGYAGLRGGILDELLMRFTDVFFALPVLLIALVIAAALNSQGLTETAIALMIVWWPAYARLARGEALKVAHQNYIEAAKLSGQGSVRMLFRHVLPNISGTMLVYATLDLGTVLLTYSGLTFLGLGVHPPTPDWGAMITTYKDYILSAPWLAFFPGLTISLGVIGFSLLGDGVKEAREAR
ncbi:MAG TPA: ABC transporter permease [Nitrososphaerales archaeon]|nr:ABC transporter permease [Nitrososphaerales archaeon]